jgi:hypothetical protein
MMKKILKGILKDGKLKEFLKLENKNLILKKYEQNLFKKLIT